jgi:hypothetical protein
LHTPLFALAAPIIAIGLTKSHIKGVGRYTALAAIALMLLYSLPFTLNNQSRSLVSNDWKKKEPIQLYFMNRPELYPSYKTAMDILAKTDVKDVGLYMDEDDWEYPFWVFAKSFRPDMQFHHVNPSAQSKALATGQNLPAYVVATANTDEWSEKGKYDLLSASEYVTLLKRRGD